MVKHGFQSILELFVKRDTYSYEMDSRRSLENVGGTGEGAVMVYGGQAPAEGDERVERPIVEFIPEESEDANDNSSGEESWPVPVREEVEEEEDVELPLPIMGDPPLEENDEPYPDPWIGVMDMDVTYRNTMVSSVDDDNVPPPVGVGVGQRFMTKDALQMYLKDYCISRHVQFRLRMDNRLCTSTVICNLIMPNVRTSFTLSPYEIIQLVKDKYHIQDESYNLLPQFFKAIKDTNRGTKYKVITTEDNVTRGNFVRFARAFWAFGPAIHGFQFCRPFISVDGTHLYGKQRTLMWTWFIACLARQVVRGRFPMCIISDRHSGIIRAVRDVFPRPHRHRFCIRHIIGNLKKRYSVKDLNKMVWRCASAETVTHYDHAIQSLEEACPGAKAELTEDMSLEQWALAYNRNMSFGKLTTNSSESVNSLLKRSRSLPVQALASAIFYRMNAWFVHRRDKAAQITTHFCPSIDAHLRTVVEDARHVYVVTYCDGIFQAGKHKVNVMLKECTCRSFQIYQVMMGDASLLYDQDSQRSEAIWHGEDPRCLECTENFQTLRHWPVDERMLPYIEAAGFSELHRVQWLRLDKPLITALVERWRSETNTFHLANGEMTITLEDVVVLLGLRGRRDFPFVPDDADRVGVMTARTHAYLLHLVGAAIFSDGSARGVHMAYLTLFEDFEAAGRYSWGAATLAFLYQELAKACRTIVVGISGCLTLMQLWTWECLHTGRPTLLEEPALQGGPLGSRWNVRRTNATNPGGNLVLYRTELDRQRSYQQSYLDFMQRLPTICVEGRHIWLSRTPPICFEIVELHVPDRVMLQFGLEQDWALYHRDYIAQWEARAESVVIDNRAHTPRHAPSDYMRWYLGVTQRFISPPPTEPAMVYHPRGHTEEALLVCVRNVVERVNHRPSTDPHWLEVGHYCQSVLHSLPLLEGAMVDGDVSHASEPSHMVEPARDRAPRGRCARRRPTAETTTRVEDSDEVRNVPKPTVLNLPP
ncbi:hypothetical protein H6P81_010256 [Aristolochia fimbriata]|uniref:Serine/threonine-protein phosphatase 7 long form-like n=1 Tax=Aristolochia fimbriata TaxID=158543 RepID=A0AAV7EPE6_ARIFI|nr:hypothetical protein H6P81_010256 [Aristolochia fimbriata]